MKNSATAAFRNDHVLVAEPVGEDSVVVQVEHGDGLEFGGHAARFLRSL